MPTEQIDAAKTRLNAIRAKCEDLAVCALAKLDRGEPILRDEIDAWKSASNALEMVRREVRQLQDNANASRWAACGETMGVRL